MKKTLMFVALVGVVALALGVTGYAYAQDDDPSSPFGRGGFGPGMMGWAGDREFGPLHETMEAAIAEALGISAEELEAAHDEGKTAWDIAQEQSLSAEQFSAMMSEARSAALQQAVADGTITQEQADWMQSRWENMQANGFGPGSGFCADGGHRGGRGHGQFWNSQP